MAVYVDELKKQSWRYGKSCHLFAYSLDELHDFALKVLELRPAWFQDKRIPHYDLTESKRKQAVKLDAVEIKLRDYIRMRKGVDADAEHGVE